MDFVNIGFNNIIASHRILSIVRPEASPIKRIVIDAKAKNFAIDATCGRKTKAVIILDSSHVVLSALSVETILNRLRHNDAVKEE